MFVIGNGFLQAPQATRGYDRKEIKPQNNACSTSSPSDAKLRPGFFLKKVKYD